jgi:hypothetical protein
MGSSRYRVVAGEKKWKSIERIVGIVAGLTIIYDSFSNKIGVVAPIARFFWTFLNTRVSLLVVGTMGLVALIVSWLIRRMLTEHERFLVCFLDGGERSLELILRAYKRKFPTKFRIMSHCLTNINRLEKKRIVELGVLAGGVNENQKEMLKLTQKGLRIFKKTEPALKVEAGRI